MFLLNLYSLKNNENISFKHHIRDVQPEGHAPDGLRQQLQVRVHHVRVRVVEGEHGRCR